MPNPPHEILHRIFHEDSNLISSVLRFMEVPFPELTTVKVGNIDATEVRQVLPRYVDTVLEAQTKEGPFLIAIEMQNRPSAEKLRNWAYYPAYMHERRGCPVMLIVICRNAKTADWARKPYSIGLRSRPTLVSTPLVVGPQDLPHITDMETVVADPYFAVFCALAHAHDPEIGGILEPIAVALPELEDRGTSKVLLDYVDRGLQDTAAQEIWRKIVSAIPIAARYRSELAMESRAEGRAEGTTNSVLQILDSRGIIVSPDVRARITACTDVELATSWVREALTVANADELTNLAEG
jgi:hypothetical protein